MLRPASAVHRRRGAPALCRAVLVGLLACMLAGAAVLGGTPYVWCVPMARVQLGPCCPSGGVHAARGHDRDVPRVEASDCCEGRRIGSLPGTTVPTVAASLPPPVFFALVPLVLRLIAAVTPVGADAPRVLNQPRAGPEPPLFALHRAYLI